MANMFKCKNCGKEYYSKKKTSKYCSIGCRRADKNVEMVCDYCGKNFLVGNGEYRFKKDRGQKGFFCSKECADKAKITSKTNVCEYCHKEYTIFNCFSDIQKFCSRECYRKYCDENRKYDSRICPRCGKEFYPQRSESKFCSHQCANNDFTPVEIEYIIKHSYTQSDRKTAGALNRSICSIRRKRRESGIYREINTALIDGLSSYIRHKLRPWKKQVLKNNNYQCYLTGETKDVVIHHCRSIDILTKETIDEMNFEIKDSIKDYSKDELELFFNKYMEIQERYKHYVCITKSIHREFHGEFGYGNNTMEQWEKFCQKYI